MNETPGGPANNDATSSFLRQFARRRGGAEADSEERCELCSARLGPMHQHLLDPEEARDTVRVRWLRNSFLRAGRRALFARAAAYSKPDGFSDG